LYTRNVAAKEVNVLIPELYAAGNRLFGKIRSQGEPSPCEVVEADSSYMSVTFDESHYAPAPGQRLVIYDADDRIVAGGEIVFAHGNCPGCQCDPVM
jgi:tRNA-specific 2-thiouridylase